MAATISKQHDTMALNMAAGLVVAGGSATFLTAVKAWLDANVARFKIENGQYTVPHVKQAVIAVTSKIK